jgi:DNA repair protein RadD
VGFVSASLGKKQHHADVIVATIGSIHKSAHLLGDIKVVIIDEAHLVSTKASDAGMYRTFLSKLGEICQFRTVGMTATPFRGNQVWLTDGDDPLFTGIASNVTMRELLDQKFLSPLVPPTVQMKTKIDVSNVGISNGDYKIGELSEVVDAYLDKVANEAIYIASQRLKWIAFTPSVANAESLVDKLNERGIVSAVVCGETPAQERADLIRQFKAHQIHCLVTVLALSTGFDVPDVDCIIWCRPTKSPVLYVQGMGRGTRIADGKKDCLVLDFTDTVERLGPVDIIKGRAKTKRTSDQSAPFCICPECGERNAPTAQICAACGARIKELELPKLIDAKLSYAALLSAQQQAVSTWHDVTRVEYRVHRKPGKPDSMRVDYYDGLRCVANEWVCFEHGGFARQKAEQWWIRLTRTTNDNNPTLSLLWGKHNSPWLFDQANDLYTPHIPKTVLQALQCIEYAKQDKEIVYLNEPTRIATRKNGKYTEVKEYEFARTERHQDAPEEATEGH